MVLGSYRRSLPVDLPRGQSAYVWGPRKVGKSTFLQSFFPDSIFLDLLDSRLRFNLLRRPFGLREIIDAGRPEQLAKPIIWTRFSMCRNCSMRSIT